MGGFGDSARARGVESEHRMLIGAIQMWQSEQENVNAWPKLLSELDKYVVGGTDKLAREKDGETVAHVIESEKLTSTYKNPEAGDEDKKLQWEYDGKEAGS